MISAEGHTVHHLHGVFHARQNLRARENPRLVILEAVKEFLKNINFNFNFNFNLNFNQSRVARRRETNEQGYHTFSVV